MIDPEKIQIYLPKYLTTEETDNVLAGIKDFPENLEKRMYATAKVQALLQGDGIKDLLVINLPNTKINAVPSMIISNTCDLFLQNKRMFNMNVCYSPIFKLEKYRKVLVEEINEDRDRDIKIDEHIRAIKKQRVTNMFFLPKCGRIEDDSIVFFDRVNNCDREYISDENIEDIRLFSLSDYGLWLFVFKMSVHFCRINEGASRDRMDMLLD